MLNWLKWFKWIVACVGLGLCFFCSPKAHCAGVDREMSGDLKALSLSDAQKRKASSKAVKHPPASSYRFERSRVEDADVAQMALTASDGTGLKLVSVDAQVVIEEPLSFTQMQVVFENSSHRVMEGQFEITLPPGAQVSRFAMQIGDKWQEGEVVEKQTAKVAYESFLHAGVDPALLEQKAGNQFSARVFPIMARQQKTLIISYFQTHPQREKPYTLFLKGLPQMAALQVRVSINGASEPVLYTSEPDVVLDANQFELLEADSRPRQNIHVYFPIHQRRGNALGLRNNDKVVARISPKIDTKVDNTIDGLDVLLDTSASRVQGFSKQVQLLTTLIRRLIKMTSSNFNLRVVCFDQTAQLVFAGKADRLDNSVVRRILKRRALGASDIGVGLRWLKEHRSSNRRLLIVSDGIFTADVSDTWATIKKGQKNSKAKRLEEQSAAHVAQAQYLADLNGLLAQKGIKRVDALLVGEAQEDEVLEQLTSASGVSDGTILFEDDAVSEMVEKLLTQVAEPVAVNVPGAKWFWPQTVSGLQAGESFLVYAELPAQKQMTVSLGGQLSQSQFVQLNQANPHLLNMGWAAARIDGLQNDLMTLNSKQKIPLVKQIVDLSTMYRVVSDYTSFLVLESEADYHRFKIDRNNVGNVVLIREGEVDTLERKSADALAVLKSIPHKSSVQSIQNPPVEVPLDDLAYYYDIDMGAADMEGMAELLAAKRKPVFRKTLKRRRARAPSIRSGRAMVRGTLSKNAIHRVIKRHYNEVRQCYNQALQKQPGLTGRVVLQFIITGRGRVNVAAIRDNTLIFQGNVQERHSMRDSHGIEKCITRKVMDWRFPAIEHGGIVIVRYPYILKPKVVRSDLNEQVASGDFGVDKYNLFPPMDKTGQNKLNPEGAEMTADVRAQKHQSIQPDGLNDSVHWVPPNGDRVNGLWRRGTPTDTQAENMPSKRTLPCEDETVAQGKAGMGNGNTGTCGPAPKKTFFEAPKKETAYIGKVKQVMGFIRKGQKKQALSTAWRYWESAPNDVMAVVALGEAAEAASDLRLAARVYGSIIDLYPHRAHMRRMAGQRLEKLGKFTDLLVLDTYATALEQRSDHPASYRLYAYALLKKGLPKIAFKVLQDGLSYNYPSGRFNGVKEIMKEDLGIIAAVWLKMRPKKRRKIAAALKEHKVIPATLASTRFVLNWETDVSDVDFHIYDGKGEHGFYGNKKLASGGRLFADVTTGFGPECFVISREPSGYPYRLQAHFYNRGPMGFGMGSLQIIKHDGAGRLQFIHRPYVVMQDDAYVDLGQFTKQTLVKH